ncbi:unnamed protein product [Paramecium octaurelia]|uniref:Uncharacterized protein n=1 Tax=Paramecium octaurelia TaxID=43137 RepID=A0A8S1TC92_PAROT|nr:unnamed protein product [Paramecium octaurelia]
MDKDDLFNVQESLQSPEEELKKQNDKKKMKVEIYISEGVYEQLRGYKQLKQSNIQNNFIIPTPLKQANVNRFAELNQQSIDNGHKLRNIKLNKESIDGLIKQYREQEQQKLKQGEKKTEVSQFEENNTQQNPKQLIFRAMKNFIPNTQSQIQSDLFTREDYYDKNVLNRITQIFNF